MRAFNVLLAVAVSLALGFGVFELGLRFLPDFRPVERINQFDSTLGWSKKPNFTAERETAEFDITFETNSFGLRDDPMAGTDKPEGSLRVLMLGDSFVLGYTVDREHLFVDQLERWWKGEGRAVDVINAGTEGYSTDQEVLWYLEHGVDFDPDLVVLFPYENDLYWNGQTSYGHYPKPRFDAAGRVETGTLADPGPAPGSGLKSWATGNLLLMLVGALAPRPELPHHFHPTGSEEPIANEFGPLFLEEPPFLADCLARTRGALSALRSRCEAEGARLLLVPIPSESAIHASQREKFRTHADGLKGLADTLWSPDKPVDAFLALGRELGIATLDPRETLRANGISATGEEVPLYFDKEWHFNQRGNEVLARFLHDEIDRLGLLAGHEARRPADLTAAASESGIPTWAFVFATLWAVLGTCFCVTYRDEKPALSFLKVGSLLALVFTIVLGGSWLLGLVPSAGPWIGGLFVAGLLGFVAYKLGRRLGTILELLRSFTLRGHWYLMPLVVVLLSIGSLLVVAASSPLIAPFIYTLF